MAEPRAFNSLGQIISRGGEIAIARLLAGGMPAGEAREIMLKRFGPLRAEVERDFFSLAERMAQAGETITRFDPTQPIPAGLIPENPELFGPSPAGRRLILGVFIGTAPQSTQREIQQFWPDIPTVRQIMERAWAEYDRRAELYPERFEDLTKKEIIETVNRIAWIERRF